MWFLLAHNDNAQFLDRFMAQLRDPMGTVKVMAMTMKENYFLIQAKSKDVLLH